MERCGTIRGTLKEITAILNFNAGVGRNFQRHKNLRATILCLAMGIMSTGCNAGNALGGSFAQAFEAANARQSRYPGVRTQRPDISLEEAYRIQRDIVRRRASQDVVSGFKGGATTQASQAAMKTTEPILGVLFESGSNVSPAKINLHPNRDMGVEAEMGFIIGSIIGAPLMDVESLKSHVASLGPVIELPELGFVDNSRVEATDLIAANIGSARYIQGRSVSPQSVDPDKVVARLYLDGALIGEARGASIGPSQWQALLWMVNRTIRLYGPIRKGALFITGSMSRPPLAKPGSYRVDYGELGSISFDVTAP